MNKKLFNAILAACLSAGSVTPAAMLPIAAFESTAAPASETATPIYTYKGSASITNGTNAVILEDSLVQTLANLENFSMNMTFSCTGSSVNALFFIGDPTQASEYFTLYVSNGVLGFEYNASGCSTKGSVNMTNKGVSLADSHKLTMTFAAGSKLIVYLDGEAVLTTNVSHNFTKNVLTNVSYAAFGKGNRASGKNNYPFTGTISKMELYDTVLSAEDAKAYKEGEKIDPVYTYSNVNSTAERVTDSNIDAIKNLSSGTWTVRFKNSATGIKYLTALSNNQATNSQFAIYINGTTVGIDRGADITAISVANQTGTVSLSDGQWHTVTVTREDSGDDSVNDTWTFYVDGKRVGNPVQSGKGFFNNVASANSLAFGFADRLNGANPNAIDGAVDTVIIHDAVLDADQVATLHEGTIRSTQTSVNKYVDGVELTDPDIIFYSGLDGSSAYRIPSLITTSKGTVLAGYDKRNQGAGDQGNIDVVVRRKEAGQTSFDNSIVVNDLLQNKTSGKSALVIDTVLLQDTSEKSPTQDRIWMVADMFPESNAIMQSNLLCASSGYITVDGQKYLRLTKTDGTVHVLVEDDAMDMDLKSYEIVEQNMKKTRYAKIFSVSSSTEDGETVYTMGEDTGYTVAMSANGAHQDRGSIYYQGAYKGNIYMYENGSDVGEFKVDRTSYLWANYSDDDGLTWSDPIDLNKDVKEDWMLFLGTGPGRGTQIQTENYEGRLVIPVYSANTNVGASQSSAVIYSDDFGKTWTLGESPQTIKGNDRATMTGGGMLTESAPLALDNGDLLLFMRNTGFSGKVEMARSKDGGATWETCEALPLNDVYCQLSVLHYYENGQEMILLSNPAGSGRNNGRLTKGTVNADGTISWNSGQIVQTGSYAYSCLTQLPTEEGEVNRFGLLYEHADTGYYVEFNEIFLDAVPVNDSMIAPTVTGAAFNYDGSAMEVSITFDKVVMATGEPVAKLQNGANSYDVSYVSGSGTKTLTFAAELDAEFAGSLYFTGFDLNGGRLESIGGTTVLNSKVLLEDYSRIDSSTLSIAEYSSQHSSSTAANTDGAVVNVLDGSNNTFWHSRYSTGGAGGTGDVLSMPQFITIGMEEAETISSVRVLGRQSASNGLVKNYILKAGMDKDNLETVATGVLDNTQKWQTIEFAPLQAQFVRLEMLDTYQGDNFCSMAEIEICRFNADAYADVNKDALRKALEETPAVDVESCSPASVEAWNAAKEAGTELLERESAGQSAVDKAVKNITSALTNLVSVYELDTLIAKGDSLQAAWYEDEGWDAFQSALASAKIVRADALTSRQVLDSVSALTYAMDSLSEKEEASLDTELAHLMIARAEAANLSEYASKGKEEFQNALSNAKTVLRTAETQEELDAAVARLNTAWMNLRKTPAKAQLDALKSA